MRKGIDERFERKVDRSGGADACHIWRGARSGNYGVITASAEGKTRVYRAHRFAYELANGAIGPGMLIRHLCHNPLGVNPSHLAEGTHADNRRDDVLAGKRGVGESAPNAKLCADDVLAIKARLRSGESDAAIARDYGVGESLIYKVRVGQAWAQIGGRVTARIRRPIGRPRKARALAGQKRML